MISKKLKTKKYVKKRHMRKQCTAANWVFADPCSSWLLTGMTNISEQLIGRELVLVTGIKCCDLFAAGIQCVGNGARLCADAQGKEYLTCS